MAAPSLSPSVRRDRAVSALAALGDWPTTGIGSLPFADPAAAVAHVWSAYGLPFAPQLTGRCDWSAERDRLRPTAWPETICALQAVPPAGGLIKLQLPGPCSLATSLAGAAAGNHEIPSLACGLGEWLAATAASCTAELAELGIATLITIDEPLLSASGISAIDASRAWRMLSRSGAAWGIHTCRRPPWGILGQAGADVLFVDVVRFPLDGQAAAVAARLISQGGRLGLGVVPSIEEACGDDAVAAAAAAIGSLRACGLSRTALAGGTFLTPACGTGPVSVDAERRIAGILGDVSRAQ